MPKRSVPFDPNDDPYIRKQLASFRKIFTGLLFPAAIPPETAAQMIGVHSDVMPFLHDKGLLKPLEARQPKRVSHYHVSEILEKTQDRQWMAKVMEAAREYHAHRNARKKLRKPAVEVSVVND